MRAAPDAEMPVRALIGYLVQHSPLYTVHFRICRHGDHDGLWLGSTGHGATEKHAAVVTEEMHQEIRTFLRVNRWAAEERTPAVLPPWRAGLRMADTAYKLRPPHHLFHLRSALARQFEATNPLIFQLFISLEAPNQNEFFDSAKMCGKPTR